MKIVFEAPKEGEEDTIIVRCRNINPEIIHLLDRVRAQDTLIGYINHEIHRLNPSEIYYIETVDRKAFLYSKNAVYESKQKLYELEEILQAWNFMRAGKSLIINVAMVKSVTPMFSKNLEVVFVNNERVIVSRQYASALKKHLSM